MRFPNQKTFQTDNFGTTNQQSILLQIFSIVNWSTHLRVLPPHPLNFQILNWWSNSIISWASTPPLLHNQLWSSLALFTTIDHFLFLAQCVIVIHVFIIQIFLIWGALHILIFLYLLFYSMYFLASKLLFIHSFICHCEWLWHDLLTWGTICF